MQSSVIYTSYFALAVCSLQQVGYERQQREMKGRRDRCLSRPHWLSHQVITSLHSIPIKQAPTLLFIYLLLITPCFKISAVTINDSLHDSSDFDIVKKATNSFINDDINKLFNISNSLSSLILIFFVDFI